MRITNRVLANNMRRSIQNNLSQLAGSQEQMSTGKQMLRPSDRPQNLSQLLSVKASLSYMEQIESNMDDGLAYLKLNDSSMQTVGDILHQSTEMAIQGSNGTYTLDEMNALGLQVDSMIDHLVDLANSSVGGRFIYAGTKNSMPPFKRVGDTITYTGDLNGIYREVLSGKNYRIDAPGITSGSEVKRVTASTTNLPQITNRQMTDKLAFTGIITVTRTDTGFTITNPTTLDGVTPSPNLVSSFSVSEDGQVITIDGATDELEGYTIDMTGTSPGDQFEITIDNKLGVFGHGREIEPGIYEVYNSVSLKDSTVDEGIFDILFRLRNNLQIGDHEKTNASIAELQQKTDQLLERRVGIGARTKHFEALKDQMLDLSTKMTEIESNLEDADLYKLSITLSQDQVTFQASLASGANMMKTTLLDFLR